MRKYFDICSELHWITKSCAEQFLPWFSIWFSFIVIVDSLCIRFSLLSLTMSHCPTLTVQFHFHTLIFLKYINCDDSSPFCFVFFCFCFFFLLSVTERRHQQHWQHNVVAFNVCTQLVSTISQYSAFTIKILSCVNYVEAVVPPHLERIPILQCISILIKILVPQMGFSSQMKIVLETIFTLNMQNKGLL